MPNTNWMPAFLEDADERVGNVDLVGGHRPS
jgi:hypothetical protein